MQTPAWCEALADRGYSVTRAMAVSGSTAVHLVRHAHQALAVAKTVALETMDARARLGAQQEAQVLKQLSHPSIVKYRDSFPVEPGSLMVIVMDWCADGDLRTARLRAEYANLSLPLCLIRTWTQQVLDGLAFVHEKGIVHRDLKSGNLFLDGPTTLKIGDFGISRVLESTAFCSTCVGTPSYMAPEIVRNEAYTGAVDMWAIGVILYEMATLKLPFSSPSLLGLVHQIASTEPDLALLDAGLLSCAHADSAESRAPRVQSAGKRRSGALEPLAVASAEARAEAEQRRGALSEEKSAEVEWLRAAIMQLMSKDPDSRPSAGNLAKSINELPIQVTTHALVTYSRICAAERATEERGTLSATNKRANGHADKATNAEVSLKADWTTTGWGARSARAGAKLQPIPQKQPLPPSFGGMDAVEAPEGSPPRLDRDELQASSHKKQAAPRSKKKLDPLRRRPSKADDEPALLPSAQSWLMRGAPSPSVQNAPRTPVSGAPKLAALTLTSAPPLRDTRELFSPDRGGRSVGGLSKSGRVDGAPAAITHVPATLPPENQAEFDDGFAEVEAKLLRMFGADVDAGMQPTKLSPQLVRSHQEALEMAFPEAEDSIDDAGGNPPAPEQAAAVVQPTAPLLAAPSVRQEKFERPGVGSLDMQRAVKQADDEFALVLRSTRDRGKSINNEELSKLMAEQMRQITGRMHKPDAASPAGSPASAPEQQTPERPQAAARDIPAGEAWDEGWGSKASPQFPADESAKAAPPAQVPADADFGNLLRKYTSNGFRAHPKSRAAA